jgi:hypothetical protein
MLLTKPAKARMPRPSPLISVLSGHLTIQSRIDYPG